MNVGEMQRKLSSWAEQNKEHRFFDLYHLLYDKEWLQLAHDYVKQNAGSKTAGCDGIDMSTFDEELDENLKQLARELKSQSFEPYPVRRVYIAKANGKLRPLGIPSIRDRIVQEALRMILEPIYEADFDQRSFGFRPNRRTMDAVKYLAVNTIGNKKFYWVIEGDISAYFDTINHKRLMKLIARRVKDRSLLRLIWKFLRAGVMENKLFKDTKSGTPQGGIISPLLANIYLSELDRYVNRNTGLSQWQREQRRRKGEGNFIYARYADDFVVLCNGTKRQAEAFKEELSLFLDEKLKLDLSKEKTKITHLNDGFKFLGFNIRRCRGKQGMVTKITIPREAVAKIRDRIRHVTSPGSHRDSVNAKIVALNRIVGGWCRYYQYTSKASSQFKKVGYILFWDMAHWLGRKYRCSIPKVCARYRQDTTFATNEVRLLMPVADIGTQIYKARVFKPNPYTSQPCSLERENLEDDYYWTGYEDRPGMMDLRPLVFARDQHLCQMCGNAITYHTAEIDHIKPVRRFKRPVDANSLDNLWTLCLATCHPSKTKSDRQMESRMH
jgi:RNA-directed DNA polymerase